MDTLYLVFKHRFQNCFGLPYGRVNLPQANGDINRRFTICQGSIGLNFNYLDWKRKTQPFSLTLLVKIARSSPNLNLLRPSRIASLVERKSLPGEAST